MAERRTLLGAAALLAAALAPPARAEEATHLYLIGDAGEPSQAGDPVLRALERELAHDPDHSFAVFLGDNVYPRGIVAPTHPEYAESVRRLDAQIAAARDSGARFLFIPGNHDWDRFGADGWNAVKREADVVLEHGGPRAGFLPRGGCPGPAVVEVADRLRLIVLDTQWWLQHGQKPTDHSTGCEAATEDEVVAALRTALQQAAGRHVVVVSHHPPLSGGGHGGHFGWKDHLFPLRVVKRWLWLPLPVIGSAYPLGRQAGVFDQDATSAAYRHMLERLEGALAETRPLAWATGHDHALEVLTGRAVRHVLVSGAGYYGHAQAPQRIPETQFASGDSGFMRLDVAPDGSLRLAVLAVDRQGRVTERYQASLE